MGVLLSIVISVEFYLYIPAIYIVQYKSFGL